MLSARERLGLNQADCATLCGIPFSAYTRLEKLDYPCNLSLEILARISLVLSIPPDDIMVESLAGVAVLNRFTKTGKIQTSRLLDFSGRQERYLLPSPDDEAERADMLKNVTDSLSTLSYREREIIKLRYGVGDGYEYSCKEIGGIFQVSETRVNQVEQKALRKLKKIHLQSA